MAMLQACLNGNHQPGSVPGLPVTPEELARAAKAVRAEGADELHFHPRGADGAESLSPRDVSAALTAVRAAVPGMPVGVSTGDWIAPGGRARQAELRAWEVLPDYVSVNLAEPDADEVIALMLAKGVGVEVGLASRADARRFLGLPEAGQVRRVLVEMEADPTRAAAEAETILAALAEGPELEVLLHGEQASLWPMIDMAARLGLDTRVGLEDGRLLPDWRPASGNAEMVRAARSRLGAG
jgi:uncharacterized protein (DUF849 family)